MRNNEMNKHYLRFLNEPVQIDITQNNGMHGGLECVGLVQHFLKEYEIIEPLILVLKQFLKVQNFNDPYTGGLSSYAVFLMIMSFIQGNNYPPVLRDVNLGRVVSEFLHFYSQFPFDTQGIYTKPPEKKTPEKPSHYLTTSTQFQSPQIDDPLREGNNVGKSSYRFNEIKVSAAQADPPQYAMQTAYSSIYQSWFCDCHFDNLRQERQQGRNSAQTTPPDQPVNPFMAMSKRRCDSILSRLIHGNSFHHANLS